MKVGPSGSFFGGWAQTAVGCVIGDVIVVSVDGKGIL